MPRVTGFALALGCLPAACGGLHNGACFSSLFFHSDTVPEKAKVALRLLLGCHLSYGRIDPETEKGRVLMETGMITNRITQWSRSLIAFEQGIVDMNRLFSDHQTAGLQDTDLRFSDSVQSH